MELRAGRIREERAGEGSARGAKCAPRGPLFLCDSRWLGTDKEIVDLKRTCQPACWLVLVILTLRRPRQKDYYEFEAILGYIVMSKLVWVLHTKTLQDENKLTNKQKQQPLRRLLLKECRAPAIASIWKVSRKRE